MTAPTHIAFAAACALLAGAESRTVIALCAGGALLPDIDHPQSAIGRVFFFLSYPLNKFFGHRGFIHSLVLWMPFAALGWLWQPLAWLALGAISHVVIDSWNLSGVRMLYPLTEKTFVLAAKNYRIGTASRGEFILMFVLIFITLGAGHIGSHGGLRAMLQAFLGNYEIARDHYEREGTKVCYMEGKLRFPDGSITAGRWLILGTEGDAGNSGLAVLQEETGKILHVPQQAKFLKAVLKPTEEKWQTLRLETPQTLQEGQAYYRPLRKWNVARPGDLVTGYIIHTGNIALSPFSL